MLDSLEARHLGVSCQAKVRPEMVHVLGLVPWVPQSVFHGQGGVESREGQVRKGIRPWNRCRLGQVG